MKLFITSLLILTAASTAMAGAVKGTYRGSATSTVYYLDALTGQFTNPRTYSRPITVTIGNPVYASGSGQRESNPFSLVAFSSTSSSVTGGDVTLLSAYAFSMYKPADFLVKYWTLSNTTSGFTGRLTNNGSSYALAVNGVAAWADLVPGRPSLGGSIMPYTFYDAKYGTSYQASLSATNISTSTRLSMRVTGCAVAGSSITYIITNISATR